MDRPGLGGVPVAMTKKNIVAASTGNLSKITNTEAEAAALPGGENFYRLSQYMGPHAIERQEAYAQRELVKSEEFPADMRQDRVHFEKMGLVFGEPDRNDTLFLPVQLPKGWKMKGTDHSMWSDLLDEKGRKRGSIFYKGAFYDRSAHASVEYRFRVRSAYPNNKPDNLIIMQVLDGNKEVYEVRGEVPVAKGAPKFYDAKDKVEANLRAQCEAWLAERFPQWKDDPTAHWDE